VAWRAAAPGVIFQCRGSVPERRAAPDETIAQRPGTAPDGETTQGLNLSRWRNGPLAEERAEWESLTTAAG